MTLLVNLPLLFHHRLWRSYKMSTKKKNTFKVVVLIILIAITGWMVYSNFIKKNTSEEVQGVQPTEPTQPSTPKDLSSHTPPVPLDSNGAETVTIQEPISSDSTNVTVVSSFNGGALVLDEKAVDDVFLTFSTSKAKAESSGKETKRSGDGSSVSMAPPRFTSERKILPITGAAIGSGDQMVMFNPGSPTGMTPPPAPEPVKTKVVFCADGDCGELTTQGYKKINAPIKPQYK